MKDVLICDLLDQWKNGNITDVIDALENDHPGLTAMFLVHGTHERLLTVSDRNSVCNLLMDRRRQKFLDEAD